MNKKQIKKSTSGITLIALVITIIVLLILAGVAISAIVKDDGIINKADSAKKETVKGDIKERVHLAVQELTIDTLGDKITKEQLETKLAQVFENPTVTEKDGKFIITIANETFEVTKTGGVTSGSNSSTGGDEELPEEPENDEDIQITISGADEVDVKTTIILTAQSENASFNATEIKWESSNPLVATVEEETGVVTGVNASINEGKVTIIAKYNNREVSNKEIIVNPVLVDCPLCTTLEEPLKYGYCEECQTEKWNEFTNNAELILGFNSRENSNYSTLLYNGQENVVLPIRVVVSKICFGCNGTAVSCSICNDGLSKIYDMGGFYKRVE